jgi:hypothetical protein
VRRRFDHNDVVVEHPVPEPRRVTIRRFATAAEADRHEIEFWHQLSDADRVLQVWRLSEEQWRLRGEYRIEPGLCRSVARIARR